MKISEVVDRELLLHLSGDRYDLVVVYGDRAVYRIRS
jgi:DNA-directed RNA polymerase subunit K/omega